MSCDVSTQWNSTFDMLNFMLKYCPEIDTMTATQNMSWCHLNGGSQENSKMFYGYICFIALFLCAHPFSPHQIFKDVTLFFLQGTLNLATVIPTMDHIDKVLATSSDSPHQFSIAIHAVLAIGKKARNQYYNKTDQSDIYQIAIGTISFYLHAISTKTVSSSSPLP
jgi:hypothetical protein